MENKEKIIDQLVHNGSVSKRVFNLLFENYKRNHIVFSIVVLEINIDDYQALVDLATTVSDEIRRSDFFGYYQDHFFILLNGSDIYSTDILMKRIYPSVTLKLQGNKFDYGISMVYDDDGNIDSIYNRAITDLKREI